MTRVELYSDTNSLISYVDVENLKIGDLITFPEYNLDKMVFANHIIFNSIKIVLPRKIVLDRRMWDKPIVPQFKIPDILNDKFYTLEII